MRIKSKELYWCADHDRHIVVTTENELIVGLNYCQGDDANGLFDRPIDEDLTSFFLAVEPILTGTTELDRINQAIWAHFEYKAGGLNT
jgi:hypothetical protein